MERGQVGSFIGIDHDDSAHDQTLQRRRQLSVRGPDAPTGRANARPMTGSAKSEALMSEAPHIACAHAGIPAGP
jgi:hypothetical protein